MRQLFKTFGVIYTEYCIQHRITKYKIGEMGMNEDKIALLRKELALEQKKILKRSYQIQILEYEDKIKFTQDSLVKIEEDINKEELELKGG